MHGEGWRYTEKHGKDRFMTHQSDDKLRKEIDQEHGPLLLFFELPQAAACAWTRPSIETCLREHPQLRLVRVDVARNPALRAQFGVARVPHLCFVRHGQVEAALTGVYTPVFLQRWLKAQTER